MSEERRTKARLTELHHRFAHGFVLRDERTDTDTALAIALRDAVHEDDVLLDSLEMAGRDIRRLGVDELAVYLIRDEVEVVFLHEVTNLTHLLLGVQVARRVIGVADKNRPCLRRDLLLKLLHRWQFKAVLDIGLHGLHHRACRDSERHVVGVRRVGHDDFIARVEATHIREHDGLRTTGSDDDLVRREVDTVFGIVTHHLRSQRLEALRRRVRQDILIEFLHCLQRLRWRLDIRLTDVQMIHMCACQFSGIGVFGQFTNRAFGHRLRPYTNLHMIVLIDFQVVV